VRFLVDAQLPRRLADLLARLGHDVLHTLELPEGNRTSDKCLCDLSESERRVLITKDADFVDSFLVQRKPPHVFARFDRQHHELGTRGFIPCT
jgi:predicted nuclease of predicted toxin-antitoxin system